MFLPKNQSSELLLELSEEQQETVAGGFVETKEGQYNNKTFEFKDEKTSKGESEDFVWPPISFTPPFQFNFANTVSFTREMPSQRMM
jgi:hypothetical protein